MAPVFPAVSTTQADIKANTGLAEVWLQCYKGFVDNLAVALNARAKSSYHLEAIQPSQSRQ